jgi:nitrous oxide reductase
MQSEGNEMSEEVNQDRRRFLGTAALTIAAAQFGMRGSADAQSGKDDRADVPALIRQLASPEVGLR